MHKKSLASILVVGLLLACATTGFAIDKGLGQVFNEPEDVPYLNRDLRDPADLPITGGTQDPLTGSPTVIQVATPRPGITCDGEWQGGSAFFNAEGWFLGDEEYVAFQDPSNLGSCAGSGAYPFDVTNVIWPLWIEAGATVPLEAEIQPVIYDADLTVPACPTVGAPLCAGPIYTVTFPGPGFYILDLPMPDQCCLNGPYFAGADFITFVGGDQVALISDNSGGAGTPCYVYNNWGFGWYDAVVDLGLNFGDNTEIYSLGFGSNESNCPGLPPDACDFYTCWDFSAVTVWGAPDISTGGDLYNYFVRFDTDLECRIVSTDIYFYTPFFDGTPTARVSLYETDGLYPTTLIGYTDVEFADIQAFPTPTNVDWSFLGLGAHFSGNVAVAVDLSPDTPNGPFDGVSGDRLYVLSGTTNGGGCVIPPPGACGDIPASGYQAGFVGGGWRFFCENFASGWRELAYVSEICCDPPPVEIPCAAPGPDDWPTFAHDFQRTSRSSMEVGNECEVNWAWQYQTPTVIQFAQPSIGNNIVYAPSNNEFTALNLHDGSLINQFNGVQGNIAYFGDDNRCEPTVIGDRVWLGGGSFGGCLNLDASDFATVLWANDATNVLACENMAAAGATRYGVTVVLDIAGDSVMFIGTADGKFYALDATTGCLYTPGGGSWATNPLTLDAGVLTTPAEYGGKLFLGTSRGGVTPGGSLYQIDAATGAIDWQLVADPEDFSAGPSIDPADGMLYAHSGGAAPFRVKIDPTLELGGGEGIVWQSGSGAGFLAPPTIGQDFVYFAQDNPSVGVLKCFKSSGSAVFNWSAVGVFQVPNRVVITCDAYLFAGDRAGRWWLLDAVNNSAAWYREMGPTTPQQLPVNGIVHGTSIAHSDVADGGDGNDYAVVAVREAFSNPNPGAGAVLAFRFNDGARPRMNQLVLETTINVPLNTLAGNLWSEADVLENVGCADLNLGPFNVIEASPATKNLTPRERYAAAWVNREVDSDMLSYFYKDQPTKKQRMLGVTPTTGELTSIDIMVEDALARMDHSKFTNAPMAAGASVIRTSAVTAGSNPVLAGTSTSIDWLYDGTGLGRDVDDEYIELVSDDPDFFPVDPSYSFGHPLLVVHYIGGCSEEFAELEFNGSLTNIEQAWNDGSLGKQDGAGVEWEDGSAPLFAGGIILVDSNETTNNRVVRAAFYDWDEGPLAPRFVPDPRPSDGQCGLDVIQGPLGQWNATGDPCDLDCQPINGTTIISQYSDTNIFANPVTEADLAAIGVTILQTEIGAENDRYGDFKLIHWNVRDRDSEAKTDLHFGTFMDWDAPPDYNVGTGRYSGQGGAADWNGYVIWDSVSGVYAFGMSALPLVASSDDCCDVVASESAHKIYVIRNAFRVYPSTCDPSYCFNGDDQALYVLSTFISGSDANYYDRVLDAGGNPTSDDNCGLLIWPPFDVAADGSHDLYSALFGVDASSQDPVTIDANAYDANKRAAKWAGFWRGDVNDDGCINLADVVWLDVNGACVLPHDANGDVNNDGFVNDDDKLYLMNYIGGAGPAPVGAWRF